MSRTVPAQIAFDFEAPAAVGGEMAVRRTPAELKLEAERNKHDKLLSDIRKKRALCEAAEARARDALERASARLATLRGTWEETLGELRGVMDELLGDESPLSKRDRARVRRLYRQVVPVEGSDDGDGEGDDGEESEPPGQDRTGRSRGEGRPDEADEAGFSAPKPSGERALHLKHLFRRLAVHLHPDRVQDAGEKERLTAVMKDVTRAYESGDLARLVEIERDLLAAVPRDRSEADVARQLAALVEQNRALRRQLRQLAARWKAARDAAPGGARGKVPGPGDLGEEAEAMFAQLEGEVDHLRIFRDCARELLAGEIGVAEFLRGPPVDESDLEDAMSQILGEMLEDVFVVEPRARPRQAKRKKARRKKRRKKRLARK